MHWLGPRGLDGGIDNIPLPVPVGGLWLCGKHAIGPDHVGAMARCGATTVVCLVEAHELADRYPAYLDWIATPAPDRIWFPIHDLHAPTVERAHPLLDDLERRVRSGEHLLIHCAAGIGRAGTIAACLLIRLGMEADAALAHVAAHRPMAGPEAGPQQSLIAGIASSSHAISMQQHEQRSGEEHPR